MATLEAFAQGHVSYLDFNKLLLEATAFVAHRLEEARSKSRGGSSGMTPKGSSSYTSPSGPSGGSLTSPGAAVPTGARSSSLAAALEAAPAPAA